MPNKRPSSPDEEISWRTEELGPEMRRRLFEKVLPSASPGQRREGPAPAAEDPKLQEHGKDKGKGTRQRRK